MTTMRVTGRRLNALLLKGLLMSMLVFTLACDDDDTPSIDTAQVSESLTTGSWRVTYFFDEKDETSDFDGYVFTFNDSGTAIATKTSTTEYGTWSTEKSSSGIVKLLLFFGYNPPLDELDEDWRIVESSTAKIKLQHVSNSGTGDTETLILEKN